MHDEKRSTVRKNLSLDILVHHDFLDPRRWRTRDLGMDSVFVRMSPDTMLPGLRVEAVIFFDDAPEADCLTLPAEIVRVSAEGVVLKFREYDTRAGAMLRDLLVRDRRSAYSASPASGAGLSRI